MNLSFASRAGLATAALVAGLAAALPAHADLMIGRPDGMGPKTIHTFDDTETYDLSGPRVQIGGAYNVDLGVTALNGPLTFGATQGAWGLGSNGEWTSAKTFVGVDAAGDGSSIAALRFDFGGKVVKAIGARMNYLPDLLAGGVPIPMYIAAYAVDGTLLEDHYVPIVTRNKIDASNFYGILRDRPAIGSFVVAAPYAVVDDLKFTAPVPEPGTYAMLLAGLAAVGWVANRRRRG